MSDIEDVESNQPHIQFGSSRLISRSFRKTRVIQLVLLANRIEVSVSKRKDKWNTGEELVSYYTDSWSAAQDAYRGATRDEQSVRYLKWLIRHESKGGVSFVEIKG